MVGTILIIKHVNNEGPGLIKSFFEHHRWPIRIIDFSDRGELPEVKDDIGAVVMLGGPMNVYEGEKYPFLEGEDRFIARVMKENIPFLGICLGAQLLAKAWGARITRSDVPEIGWYEVELTPEGQRDPLFYGLPPRLKVFQWHEDTFEVPEGGTLLARGERWTNQAFKIGHHAYGLQFHTEATTNMIDAWLDGLGSERDVKGIREETLALKDFVEEQERVILFNFKRLIESSLRCKRIIKQYVEDTRCNERKAICWWEIGSSLETDGGI